MRLTVCVLVGLLSCSVARAECPLPELALFTSDDGSFDVEQNRVVMQIIWTAATHTRADLQRAGEAAHLLGRNRDSFTVAYATFALATRLRQLDCAVLEGTASSPDATYASIAEEAQVALTGSPPAKVVVPRAPRDPARHALGLRVGGGVLLAAAAGFVAGALTLTIRAARYQAPPPCKPDAFLCFNGLTESFHQLDIVGAVGFWLVGVAATATGAALIARGNYWAEKGRVTPSVSIWRDGAFAGLRGNF
jgi:hypothetical protein